MEQELSLTLENVLAAKVNAKPCGLPDTARLNHSAPVISTLLLTDACGGNGMANEKDHIVVPATVQKVLKKFLVAMRDDPSIPEDGIARLEALLLKGEVPKPDDIKAALFEPPEGDA